MAAEPTELGAVNATLSWLLPAVITPIVGADGAMGVLLVLGVVLPTSAVMAEPPPPPHATNAVATKNKRSGFADLMVWSALMN